MDRKYFWTHVLICGVGLLALLAVADPQLRGQSDKPTVTWAGSTSYIFQLRLGETVVAEYTGCTGLGSSNDIVETETVADSGGTFLEKTPGALRWHNITLRRIGVIGKTVALWRKAMEDGNTGQAFRDGAILMLPTDSDIWVAKWTFQQRWVASLSLNESMEELVIVHEGLEYTRPEDVTTHRRPAK